MSRIRGCPALNHPGFSRGSHAEAPDSEGFLPSGLTSHGAPGARLNDSPGRGPRIRHHADRRPLPPPPFWDPRGIPQGGPIHPRLLLPAPRLSRLGYATYFADS